MQWSILKYIMCKANIPLLLSKVFPWNAIALPYTTTKRDTCKISLSIALLLSLSLTISCAHTRDLSRKKDTILLKLSFKINVFKIRGINFTSVNHRLFVFMYHTFWLTQPLITVVWV